MPRVDFDQLPDDARLWIFTAEWSLSDAEQAQLLTEVDRFIGQWGAHDVPLTAGRELRYDRFLFVAVDQRKAGPSGCSIDALVRQTKALEQEIGIELVNHAPVVFRQDRPSSGCHATSSPSSSPRGRWVSRRRSLTTR